ncbi:MAG: SDR family NAD(P)-dependent oxidoreductase [Phenylobacterium sp.]|uniref:SDR family NAD(P)-dependent oxidoreductase n=1 Tax=Phenylobacterium sp. TaxID=1871053 RepID=UPI0012048DF8|nr:SDR family NAD(P)-dependent oxidoreductase [Phenylobacterium sp.]TAJ70239.1 MAG: SDR family NAD(P)-dependent oxidoreductase [Phenylobacterium sp.]
MSLQGRIAIVTGAGGGLGRAHALYLARNGARVVVNDVAEDSASAVAAEIVAAGGEAVGMAASVTDEAAVATMVAGALDRWGRVDILVNNAGILRDKTFAKMTLDDFRLVIDVHLMGAAICTKAVWDVMREQRYGRVVMTTSSSGLYGNFGQANYGAAKMALVGLMQTLAIEGEKYGVRVNCLAPTAATQMTHGVLSAQSLALLGPEQVSPALLALVGEDAPTRTVLCAGAGHFAQANVTLTRGRYLGTGDDAGQKVIAHLAQVGDRTDEIVPQYGFLQAERELAAAGLGADVEVVKR